MTGTERQIRHHSLIHLPPSQAGLAAALRRAFRPPEDDVERQLATLLEKLG